MKKEQEVKSVKLELEIVELEARINPFSCGDILKCNHNVVCTTGAEC